MNSEFKTQPWEFKGLEGKKDIDKEKDKHQELLVLEVYNME
jgi:hypothetical protein